MFVSTEATILHADVDSFYASVEQRDDPRLRGRPVVVGAGVVLAASYEAKAFGVRTAMGGATARRLCPDAVVVSPRMSAYVEASKAIFEVFEDATPLVEGLSIDEAFLDVRGMRRLRGSPAQMAARLRRSVREQVGLPITVGVARTKFLAKVASGVAKPDGLLVVQPDRELAFLHALPVERLWGVGAVTARQAAPGRDRDRRPGGRAHGGRPRFDARASSGPQDPRARHEPRSAPRPGAPPARLDRRPTRSRPLTQVRRRDRRRPARPGGSGHAPNARRRARGQDRRTPASVRRLLTRDPLRHARNARPPRRRRSSMCRTRAAGRLRCP